MATTREAPLRRDAQRNREAILTTARQLFAESGEVPMYEVARSAEVGQATLYRHFPDRSALVLALFAEQLERLERLAAEHAGDPDAIFVLLREVAATQTRFHGMVDCLHGDPCSGSERDELRQRFADLVKPALLEAKAAGRLRRDVTVDDVSLLVAMIDGALGMESDAAGRAAAAMRALTLALDGLVDDRTGSPG